MSVKSTLNIDDILENNNVISDDDISDNEDNEIREQKQKGYTWNDILNHPENQGTIRIFILFFIAMIIIPIMTVMFLNKYVWKYYLLDWTNQWKDNLSILICVGIAHMIGIVYVIYAYSGEDRIPANILDSKKNDDDSSDDDDDDDEVNNVTNKGQNGLRHRKTNVSASN